MADLWKRALSRTSERITWKMHDDRFRRGRRSLPLGAAFFFPIPAIRAIIIRGTRKCATKGGRRERGTGRKWIRMRGKGVRRRRHRRRDIDRAGAVIGKTCLSILQSIIERHCHVNGNRIEIAMEMAAPRHRLVLLRLSAGSRHCRSAAVLSVYPNLCNFYNNVGAYMRRNFSRPFLSAVVRSTVFPKRFFFPLLSDFKTILEFFVFLF